MEYAVGLVILWVLLFLPPGLAMHWLVLGTSARKQALPVALLSGMSLAIVVIAAARQAGMMPSSQWLQGLFVLSTVVCALAAWRRTQVWRTREFGLATTMAVAALLLLQMPVWSTNTTGPLGYGTRHEPVEQAATVRALASEQVPPGTLTHQAGEASSERWSGYEYLAAFTIAAGDRRGGTTEPAPGTVDDTGGKPAKQPRVAALTGPWSAYTMLDLMAAALISMVALPLFVLARWRGIGGMGQTVAMLVGVTSPAAMLTLGLGQVEAVAAIPFVTAACLSLLVSARDRGWYAVAAVNASAAFLVAGPAAVLPIVLIGVLWTALRRGTREHLAHTDVPVSADRPLAAGVVTVMFALYGGADALLARAPLPYSRLHDGLREAVTSWPFGWIGTTLHATGPSTMQELAIWLVGPALLSIAVAYGFARHETRELSIVIGTVACVALGAAWALAGGKGGQSFVEFTLLVTSPLLAMVCVRTVGLARAAAAELNSGRLTGTGPILLIAVLGLMSVASSSVSGSRMVHSPAVDTGSLGDRSPTLMATVDPWVPYLLDEPGLEAIAGDADSLIVARDSRGTGSLVYGPYRQVLLAPNPFASDPPSRFVVDANPTDLPARVFVDVRSSVTVAETDPAASGSGTKQDASKDGIVTPVGEEYVVPLRHDPVEDTPSLSGPNGLLVPGEPVESCSIQGPARPCEPEQPVLSGSCEREDINAARSLQDPLAPSPALLGAREAEDHAQLVSVAGAGRGTRGAADRASEDPGSEGAGGSSATANGIDDSGLDAQPADPQLLGVACFDVPLRRATRYVKVHIRDVGLVLSAADAVFDGTPGKFAETERSVGGVDVTRLRTSERGAVVKYGNGRLHGNFEISVEGSFGAGAIGTGGPDATGNLTNFLLLGGYGGWTPPLHNIAVNGDIAITNDTGTRLELGRVAARSVDVAAGCDIVLDIGDDAAAVSVDEIVDGRTSLHVGIQGIDTTEGVRTAHIVVGSYMQRHGLPRTLMVDWTEQFDSRVRGTPCDGAVALIDQQLGRVGSAFSDR